MIHRRERSDRRKTKESGHGFTQINPDLSFVIH